MILVRWKKSSRKLIFPCALRCHRNNWGHRQQRALSLKHLSVPYPYQHTSRLSADPRHALQSPGSWLSQGCKPEQPSLKGTLILAVIFILQKAFEWSICIKISHPKHSTCSLRAACKIRCSDEHREEMCLGRFSLSLPVPLAFFLCFYFVTVRLQNHDWLFPPASQRISPISPLSLYLPFQSTNQGFR